MSKRSVARRRSDPRLFGVEALEPRFLLSGADRGMPLEVVDHAALAGRFDRVEETVELSPSHGMLIEFGPGLADLEEFEGFATVDPLVVGAWGFGLDDGDDAFWTMMIADEAFDGAIPEDLVDWWGDFAAVTTEFGSSDWGFDPSDELMTFSATEWDGPFGLVDPADGLHDDTLEHSNFDFDDRFSDDFGTFPVNEEWGDSDGLWNIWDETSSERLEPVGGGQTEEVERFRTTLRELIAFRPTRPRVSPAPSENADNTPSPVDVRGVGPFVFETTTPTGLIPIVPTRPRPRPRPSVLDLLAAFRRS